MTDQAKISLRKHDLRTLIASVRSGQRSDLLTEETIRAGWNYLIEGIPIEKGAYQVLHVKNRDDLLKVIKEIRLARHEMRPRPTELASKSGNGK